ncbi:hypothetical protein JQ557_23910 [Bradyrhizobium sp. U87765 SZCCT0131]|uniref:hypothetical protein n=1 Tax=unclassified Bradyrhizobium TaxID=2631580 RepID=UPI001BA7A8C4|nr:MULTISPECIES: hypothetical protein [unclassified Bradyrhizobium]MBR1221064.1 hypothetical protein [Bradyrhizobium sp. U87765 SZCCT0131]MBR1260116.1 hypothetical protein [Bradyrhizobium sp. U87765 SZCCT0134]MBR1307635.1 hypothetical protein [Bradyrhizobium sp. U87765 SZCCT0110]MBR1321589.1 hypothetical protein [Bradyrhizobium sp. U87765 SZCCT0109]MBR1349902.1 hypothetical protein [Bradyrhizobium sp. U87765 SZCCT0048]
MTDKPCTSHPRRWREAIELHPGNPELALLSLRLVQTFTALKSAEDRQAVLDYAQRLLALQTSR